ncbi:hypothetical protein [Streptomyces sp. NPDC088748]|uniref:hypothetical protein n=1 Tax=Streptomyces sp. NPDC088748 TaxID=3365887 RepID=UPI00381E6533
MASAVQAAGPWLLDYVSGGRPGQGISRGVILQIERYGMWALTGLALLPSPPRTAVLVCALAGISPWTITLAVLVARPVPVTALTVMGAKGPRLLRRFRLVGRVLAEVEASRTLRR